METLQEECNTILRTAGIVSSSQHQLFIMPPRKYCPLKFGTTTNAEGMLIEIPCIRNDCAGYFDTPRAVFSGARELYTSRNMRKPKGIEAD